MHAYTPRWLTAERLGQRLAWLYAMMNWWWVLGGILVALLVVTIVAFLVYRD